MQHEEFKKLRISKLNVRLQCKEGLTVLLNKCRNEFEM